MVVQSRGTHRIRPSVVVVIVRVSPGAAEFGAAGGFFGGDAEFYLGAAADVLPGASERAEMIARDGIGRRTTPHPGPMAPRARHKSVALNKTFASRIVVPSEWRGRTRAVEGEFGFADGGVAFGDFLAELDIGTGVFVIKDTLEGGEAGDCNLWCASGFEGSLLDEREAGFIVGNGIAVEEVEELGHGHFVVEVFADLILGEEALAITLQFIIGDDDGPFATQLGHGFADAEFRQPIAELVALVLREVLEFFDRLEGGIHGRFKV